MNNKSKLLIASILACVTAGGVAGFVAGANANITYAAKSVVPHKIELNAENISSSTVEAAYAAVSLTKASATRNGDPFSISDDGVYCYGETGMTANENGHIVTADSVYYHSVSIGINATFKNLEGFTNVILRGKFYFNEYKTDPVTELEYDSSYYYDGAFNIYEDEMYKLELDSIEINYTCLA